VLEPAALERTVEVLAGQMLERYRVTSP
jgi:hypothetical protein